MYHKFTDYFLYHLNIFQFSCKFFSDSWLFRSYCLIPRCLWFGDIFLFFIFILIPLLSENCLVWFNSLNITETSFSENVFLALIFDGYFLLVIEFWIELSKLWPSCQIWSMACFDVTHEIRIVPTLWNVKSIKNYLPYIKHYYKWLICIHLFSSHKKAQDRCWFSYWKYWRELLK